MKCKFCGKANEKGSTYCIICGSKLNSTPNLTKQEEKALYDKIITKYIRRYHLTLAQQKTLNERLLYNNFDNTNFYKKISSMIKDIIIENLNEKEVIITTKSVDFYEKEISQLEHEFNLKIVKIKKIVIEDFTKSKITQNHFISSIEFFNKKFYEQIKIIEKIIELNTENSEILDNEINENINILKMMIGKINALTNEIVIAIASKNEKQDIEELLNEMDNLINSVKDYSA